MRVNKCRCCYLIHCCSTLKRKCLEQYSYQHRTHTAHGDYNVLKLGFCTITSVTFPSNCQLQHIREWAETWLADREVNSSPTHHMVINTTMHYPERKERRREKDIDTDHPTPTNRHVNVQPCVNSHRKSCLNKLLCITQSIKRDHLWWHALLHPSAAGVRESLTNSRCSHSFRYISVVG